MRIQVIPSTELAAKLENVIDAYEEHFPQVEPRVRPFYPCIDPIYGKVSMTFLHNFEQLDYEELILFFQRYETIYYEFSRLHIYFYKTDALFYERNGETSWSFHYANKEKNPLFRSKYAPTFERISQKICEIFEGYKLHPDFVL